MMATKFNTPRYAENPIRSTATGRARLTEDDVRQIRYLFHVEHWTIPEIKRAFFPSMATETLARAARGETWGHVTDARIERAVEARHEPPREGEEDIAAKLRRASAALRAGKSDADAFNATDMLDELKGEKRPPVSPLDEE